MLVNRDENESQVVIDYCQKILADIPERVVQVSTKRKQLTFGEAVEKLKSKLGDKYYENSAMITILRQEIDRFDNLLAVIHRSTSELIKALKGEIVISKATESTFNSILVQKVPQIWEENSYPSLKPLASWLKDLKKRTQFFGLWAKTLVRYAEDAYSIMNPTSLWMSSFFFPQGCSIFFFFLPSCLFLLIKSFFLSYIGLLAAISQNYARKLHVSIDSLVFKYDVKNELFDENEVAIEDLFDDKNEKLMSVKEDGILFYGLYMDGGKWDRAEKRIVDSAQRFLPMPHFLCKLVKVSF